MLKLGVLGKWGEAKHPCYVLSQSQWLDKGHMPETSGALCMAMGLFGKDYKYISSH